MLINIRYKTAKYKDDLITIDFRLNQIRYLIKPEHRGFIHFINISHDDADAYLYLFNEDKHLFFKSLREDLFNNNGIKTQLKNFEVLK